MTDRRPRPVRRDARRNYDNLLKAADGAFDTDGVSASLEAIAKSAGVAVGTLYAHFPTRDHLLATLLAGRTEHLIDLGAQLADDDAIGPDIALAQWLREFGRAAATYPGLSDRAGRDTPSPLRDVWGHLRETLAALIGAAQFAGACRVDADAAGVLTMAAAVAGAARAQQTSPDGYVALIADGLAAPSPAGVAPTPGPGSPPFSPTVGLLTVSRVWDAEFVQALTPLGLTTRKYGLLGHIRATPGISFSELARRSRITVQSAHTAVGAFVAAGLVDDATAHAGSASTLRITAAGERLLVRAAEVVTRLDAEFAGPYPELTDALRAYLARVMPANP